MYLKFRPVSIISYHSYLFVSNCVFQYITLYIYFIYIKYHLTEEEALKNFYESATGASLADDETGLYGQSILYIFGLYVQEQNGEEVAP